MEILLQCESTSALLNIRNMDSKTILSELVLKQNESGKSLIEHLTEQYPSYFNTTARDYIIRVILKKFT